MLLIRAARRSYDHCRYSALFPLVLTANFPKGGAIVAGKILLDYEGPNPVSAPGRVPCPGSGL
jgi:hypothetical protein